MQDLIPLLPSPSHYLGTEYNTIHKDRDQVQLRWALAFPDLYNVGMSYLGQKILYHILNQESWIWAERVFAPAPQAAGILRKHNQPLCTLESKTGLADLDILGFSLTHELCFTTVLYMLDLAGIPLRREQRNDAQPVIIGGGSAVFNPEPVADFFDLFLLGDGEQAVLEISKACLQAKNRGKSRQELLLDLKSLPGVYVPQFFQLSSKGQLQPLLQDYKQVHKTTIPYLWPEQYPLAQVMPFGKPVHDRLSLEIARGCTRGCRFCQAGIISRPVRERALQDLEYILPRALSSTGYEELSFLSLSTGDFSCLEGLFASTFARCSRDQVSISLPSLRAGSLSPELMALLSRLRRTGITLAPEAGSQKLRDTINKDIQEDALLEHCSQLFALGWTGVKLYFMIGLPGETDQDLEAIHELCRKVQHMAGKKSRRPQITAAIAPFVPKPHTPFQWARQISLQEIERRIQVLKGLFKSSKGLSLRWHQPEMSFLEGVFSRGDRELSQVLELAYQQGDILSSWQEHFDFQLWLNVFNQCSLNPEGYLQQRQLDHVLPWDHLQTGVDKDFLFQEWAKASSGLCTKDCRYNSCGKCGVCDRKPAAAQDLQPRNRTGVGLILNQPARDQEQDSRVNLDLQPSDPGHKEIQLRIWFRKTGPAKYLSQLEMQSSLERTLRRANLPLSFSRGFHPKPLLSFGRALPVGVGSLAEWFCIYLRHKDYPADILYRLNNAAPAGLVFFRIQQMQQGQKSMPSLFEEFELTFNVDQQHCSRYKAAWLELLRSPEMLKEFQGKKGSKVIDLRAMLLDILDTTQNKLQISFDWRQEYISPLKIVQTIHPELQPTDFELLKLSQSSTTAPDYTSSPCQT